MRMLSLFGIAFCLLIYLGLYAQQEDQRRILEEALRELGLVTVSKKDAHISEVIAELKRQVRINIVLNPKNITPQDRITIDIKEVPFRTALETILELAGLVIEQETPELIRIGKPPRVSIDLSDAPLKEVINIIAKLSGANIIVSPEVKGTVTVTVRDVPWNEVLEGVVKTLGFRTVRERYGIIRVVDLKELRFQMETRIFKLKYIMPPSTYKAKIETPYSVGKAEAIPDRPSEKLKEFTLLKILSAVLTRDAQGRIIGSMEYDMDTNSLVITDTKPVLDQIGAIISKLDVEPEQILIDVKYISTTNEDILKLGVNYSFGEEGGIGMITGPVEPVVRGVTPGETKPIKYTALPFGLGHEIPVTDQYFLTEYDMRATLRLFKKDRYTRLIQSPTVAALNNTEATIFVGESVPYAEQKITAGAAAGAIQTTLSEGARSPVKVGFQLLIIPHIIPKTNKVILTIIPQNEFLSGTSPEATVPGFEHFEVAGQVIDLPRIARTTLITRLMLESGHTAVLGGLIVNRGTYEDRKIPLLGDIPVFGYLFKIREDRDTREHLLIFVTPRIVRGVQPTVKNIERFLKRRLETQQKEMEAVRRYLQRRQRETEEELNRLRQEDKR
jgi:type IV pilus assembly protein PilQ